MVTPDAFLTVLYVTVDDFGKDVCAAPPRPGPAAKLSCSEVVTLALFSQWAPFRSERAFYRYAQRHLRAAFPGLPHRSQFNRLVRRYRDAIAAFCRALARWLGAAAAPYEALDSTAAPTRNHKRRGRGWLGGQADRGWSNRLGWYEGFHVLLAATPMGVLTGFGFGAASTHDQLLAETFFGLRRAPTPRLPTTGAPAEGPYIADSGFAGRARQRRYATAYGAVVLCPPKRSSRQPGSRAYRRWLAGLRQIIETVTEKLHGMFRLSQERPHTLTGFQARLAAKAALHNFCIWLNERAGRPRLAFADLIDW
jgi:hypothetical protein